MVILYNSMYYKYFKNYNETNHLQLKLEELLNKHKNENVKVKYFGIQKTSNKFDSMLIILLLI